MVLFILFGGSDKIWGFTGELVKNWNMYWNYSITLSRGPSEVDKSIDEFQSVLTNDGGDLDSRWSKLLEEPHSRGYTWNRFINLYTGFRGPSQSVV
ncbi:General substrate transporter [Artemisia annua]|uniref:General substrate transporter n=1 Tax=Artemisia annua TaxID=35608 RepID=A0A2U1QL22_ARTAN|nr:General substrate transporter [Artemisia annua]